MLKYVTVVGAYHCTGECQSELEISHNKSWGNIAIIGLIGGGGIMGILTEGEGRGGGKGAVICVCVGGREGGREGVHMCGGRGACSYAIVILMNGLLNELQLKAEDVEKNTHSIKDLGDEKTRED